MTDTNRPATPASVERMSVSSARGGGGGGMGSMLTLLLAVACVVLIGACFFINSAKGEAQRSLETAKKDLDDAKMTIAANTSSLAAKDMKIQQMAADLNRSIPLHRLPEPVKAPTVNEAIAKIQQLSEGPQQAARGGAPLPATDSPTAWLEMIAKQVARGSINTKNENSAQLNKGIQIVLNKIGAFNKPASGNPADTYAAVVAFQKANRLDADGIIGKGTWGKVREKLESVAAVHE